jgi:pilus assembly protein TadC
MKFEEIYKKAEPSGDIKKFSSMILFMSLISSTLVSGLIAGILLFNRQPVYYSGFVFLFIFLSSFVIFRNIPLLKLNKKKAYVESDLLYSIRHFLLKLESGSALLNSLESVSKLNTKSSFYFKQLLFDVSMGMPLENAIERAVEYSPSKAYTKFLNEIKTSLKTGADLQNTLRNTLDDITKEHLIHIQEYGKKLNPMTMFYMIIGTILPSLGTAILIVGSSMINIEVGFWILGSVLFVLLMLQIFFVISFRSLKPEVMG